jgi:hypothetical protein
VTRIHIRFGRKITLDLKIASNLSRHIFGERRDCVTWWQLIVYPSVYFDGDEPPSLHPFLGAADPILRHSFVLWRHWRTMSILASRSVRILKTDGLLARSGELCGIIRACYLSPFFPFVLGFALWRYLRPQPQTGDRAVLTRNKRVSASRSRFRGDVEAAGLQAQD